MELLKLTRLHLFCLVVYGADMAGYSAVLMSKEEKKEKFKDLVETAKLFLETVEAEL